MKARHDAGHTWKGPTLFLFAPSFPEQCPFKFWVQASKQKSLIA
jgi:hypothetical protein